MENGEYRIGPTKIFVENGYTSTNGKVLAGTTTMLDSGWHSLMSYGHLDAIQAARAVTSNAAKSIGFTDRGFLRPRLLADIAFFERETHKPLMTVTRGEIVYDAKTNYRIKGLK
jgi:N-acetylglucosamine-6-phosphate deacetylase